MRAQLSGCASWQACVEHRKTVRAGCTVQEWLQQGALDVVDQVIDGGHAGLQEAAIQLHDGVPFLDASHLPNSALKHLGDDHSCGELALCYTHCTHLRHVHTSAYLQMQNHAVLEMRAWVKFHLISKVTKLQAFESC
jgi:hypothetical protein